MESGYRCVCWSQPAIKTSATTTPTWPLSTCETLFTSHDLPAIGDETTIQGNVLVRLPLDANAGHNPREDNSHLHNSQRHILLHCTRTILQHPLTQLTEAHPVARHANKRSGALAMCAQGIVRRQEVASVRQSSCVPFELYRTDCTLKSTVCFLLIRLQTTLWLFLGAIMATLGERYGLLIASTELQSCRMSAIFYGDFMDILLEHLTKIERTVDITARQHTYKHRRTATKQLCLTRSSYFTITKTMTR